MSVKGLLRRAWAGGGTVTSMWGGSKVIRLRAAEMTSNPRRARFGSFKCAAADGSDATMVYLTSWYCFPVYVVKITDPRQGADVPEMLYHKDTKSLYGMLCV